MLWLKIRNAIYCSYPSELSPPFKTRFNDELLCSIKRQYASGLYQSLKKLIYGGMVIYKWLILLTITKERTSTVVISIYILCKLYLKLAPIVLSNQ